MCPDRGAPAQAPAARFVPGQGGRAPNPYDRFGAAADSLNRQEWMARDEMDQALYPQSSGTHSHVRCSDCNLRSICLPVGLTLEEMRRIDGRLVLGRHKLARGSILFQAGDRFDAVFAIWTGYFKTCVSSKDGREQVTGFQMAGELVGLDGIGSGRHQVDAVALDDSQVCVIPYTELEMLALEVTSLQQQLHRFMSREIVRNHDVMLLLGSMNADERLAAFLLNLTQRQRARGFSGSSIVLRMSREEIGSFLGLKIETVSRTFSKFQANGILFVRHRQIQVVDPVGLQWVVDGEQAGDVPALGSAAPEIEPSGA
jgi:CRP/FNR family transcriptional regulator